MKKTRQITLALVMMIVVASVLAVCAFAAYDLDLDLPTGAVEGGEKWVPADFSDIDGVEGWVQIGGTADYSGTETSWPTMATLSWGRFYWNKVEDKGVFVLDDAMVADSSEWNEITGQNTSGIQQKYARAAAFVDVTNGTVGSDPYKANLGKDGVSATTETSFYVNANNRNVEKYPVYTRWSGFEDNNNKKAKDIWEPFYVTKASYDAYIAEKTRLSENLSGDELNDALVEYVFENFAGYKLARNRKENGANVMLTWVFKKLSDNGYVFDTIEFRVASGVKNPYFNSYGMALRAIKAKTILFDTEIDEIGFGHISRGLFYEISALKTFAHVDFAENFAENGSYSPKNIEEGVDLSGFTGVTPYTYGAVNYHASHLLYKAGMTKVEWFTSLKSGETEYAGVIDDSSLYGATSLEELIIPANVTLTQIKANAFNGCTALKLIHVKGAVSNEFTIDDKNAFTNVSNLTIKVYSELDKAFMDKALAAAGVDTNNVTVVAEKADIDLENAIVSQGFSVRMKDYTGLRALFSFDLDVEAANNANGYTLVSYGVFATSYKNFIEIYNGNEDILFAYAKTIENNTGSAVKYVPVYNADGTGANRYVDYNTRTFCISLTNISSANALADIFMAGYAIWQDADGNEYYTITTYDMADGEKAVNLYEITLGLTKSGIINSENTDDICFWQTLKVGALKTNEFNTANDATTKGYVLPEDGYFEYLDVDWHAYTGASKTTGWHFNPDGVDTQASGVVWSVLKYNDNEYVLVIRNKNKSAYTELSIPQYSAGGTQYNYYAPYDYRYGKSVTIATLTTYNPALSQNDYNKIKTLVVDHGITGTGANGFAGLTSVETIIYPNGLSGKGEYKFIGSTSVRNVIWCHTDNAGNPVAHLSEFEAISNAKQPLFDLRGMTELDYSVMLRGCSSVENVVLPNVFHTSGRAEYTFYQVPTLKRVWTDGDAIPNEGVVDLSSTNLKTLVNATFGFGSALINTVKLPDTVSLTFDATKMANKTGYANVFGVGLSTNFECSDAVATAIVEYVKNLHTNTTPGTINCADNIFINEKSVLTLIED